MDYQELQLLVEFYLHRTDMTARIPGFIELARDRLSKDCRFLSMQTYITLSVEAESEPLPADYLQVKSITTPVARGGSRPLQFHNNDNFGRVSSAVVSGGIQFYTIRARDLVFAPFGGSVDSPIVVNLNYYARPQKLVDPEDTNSILENYPTLYLHSTLMYAHNAIQDHESEQVSTGDYRMELSTAKESEVFGQSGSPSMLGV